jgi:hypothetical protein
MHPSAAGPIAGDLRFLIETHKYRLWQTPTQMSANGTNWQLIFAITGLAPPDRSFETSTLLVPSADDPRLRTLLDRDEAVRKYLGAFVDEQNQSYDVAALLSIHERPDLESIYAFRDALAFSTVAGAIERRMIYRSHNLGLLYSDYFRFHPTMLGHGTGRTIVTRSQALHGIDDLDTFVGRLNPVLPPGRSIRSSDIDQSIYLRLRRLWRERFGRNRNSPLTRAVFRALNMAFQASSLPHNDLALDRDLGMRLAQWIAAFEILVWPATWRAGFDQVEAQLSAYNWQNQKCSRRKYRINRGGKRLVTLPIHIYDLMYKARNDYLHGNPIKHRTINPFRDGEGLLAFAPLLFRVVLDVMLPRIFRLTPDEGAFLSIRDTRSWRDFSDWGASDVERAIVAAKRIPRKA